MGYILIFYIVLIRKHTDNARLAMLKSGMKELELNFEAPYHQTSFDLILVIT